MNIVKMSVATVLALLYLVLAIPLAFLILLLFVVFVVFGIIIGPLADCFIKILDFISD